MPDDVLSRVDSAMVEGARRVKLPTLDQLVSATPQQPRHRATKAKTHEESFRDLDEFLDEARAGMGDDALCRAANVSATAVLAWRRARGVKRVKGWRGRREAAAYAVDTFGDGYEPELHAVDSELNGTWEFPEFVLRFPIKYRLFARLSHALVMTSGISAQTVAAGFGLRERDVTAAVNVQLAHLARVSVACAGCGTPVDPAYGKTCSTPCQEKK